MTSNLAHGALYCPSLVSLHSLGIVPVRVDEERPLHSATLACRRILESRDQERENSQVTVNFSQLIVGPGPAVSEIAESDARLHGLLGLLVAQLASLLLYGPPHDWQAEVHSHPGGHHVLGKCCALQVDEAKERLSVL